MILCKLQMILMAKILMNDHRMIMESDELGCIIDSNS